MRLKRTIQSCFLTVFLSVSAFGQQESYNNKAFMSGLNGTSQYVRTSVVFSGKAIPTDSTDIESYIQVDNYNQQGIRTGQQMYSKDGTLIGSTDITFSPDGNIRTINYLDQYGNLTMKIDYTYTPLNNWETAKVYRGGFNLQEQITYGYDANGRISEISKINSWGVTTETEYFFYNLAGQDSAKVFFDQHKKIKSDCRFKYDSNGNNIAYTVYGPDGTITETYEATFSPNNVIKSSLLQKYDPQLVNKTGYLYDDAGNPIEKLESNRSNGFVEEVTRSVYEYDTHNNWVEKTVYVNDNFFMTADRQIRYY